jgi:hypothetical protein
VKSAEVGQAIDHLRLVFAELTDHLRTAPIGQVARRLRSWDNYQRASMGRGETLPITAREVKESFALADRAFESRGDPIMALPDSSNVPSIAGLDGVVKLAARLAVPPTFDDDHLIVTLFLYRVVVRAGHRYRGFLHRDIAVPAAPVGSVIFYPTVRWPNIQGADLGVHLSDRPTDELEGHDPDVSFAPRVYEQAALVLPYPRNLAHGVRPSTNPQAPRGEATDDVSHSKVAEFLSPGETTFVKDMAVLTFTQTSAIEDHIP